MKLLLLLPVTLLSLTPTCWSQVPSFGGCPDVNTQATLDVDKYLGDWYEIYAFPTTFEKGGCTRARYTKKDNGHINILNRSIQNNNTITAVGDAFQPNSSDPAKLLVQFAKGAPYAHYWVVHTDYTSFSLIFSCEAIAKVAHVEYAWILARNMTLDEKVSTSLMDELEAFKVDVTNFKKSDQKGCPP